MKFMVTFPLTHHAYKERVSRFLENGAPPPEGVKLLGRWFTAAHSRGWMVVEADDAGSLLRYTSEWADIMDFEIYPILADDEAAPILAAMQ